MLHSTRSTAGQVTSDKIIGQKSARLTKLNVNVEVSTTVNRPYNASTIITVSNCQLAESLLCAAYHN